MKGMYRLHGFCQSGNSFKVAFMLRALGVAWDPVFVDYMKGGQTRDPNWREGVNEMGEAPVLEDGARRLSQSGAILSYLADKHGRFGGRTADEKLRDRAGTIEQGIDKQSLLDRCSDVERAQMLLGYLARPKLSNSETPST